MSDNHKRILLAEDDQFISQAYRDGLTIAGFEVKTAGDGDQALEILKEFQPDLILLDLIMPDKDGFAVLEELQKNPKLNQIPVLVLSNLGQQTDVNRAMELGAKDYIVKSGTSMKEIIGHIQQHI